MKREDLIGLYGRLGFVLGVKVIALSLVVEYGAQPLPSQPRVSIATIAQEPEPHQPPVSVPKYSRFRLQLSAIQLATRHPGLDL